MLLYNFVPLEAAAFFHRLAFISAWSNPCLNFAYDISGLGERFSHAQVLYSGRKLVFLVKIICSWDFETLRSFRRRKM